MPDSKSKINAESVLRDYLRSRRMRLTAERQAIARRVASTEGHFTAEALTEALEADERFHVSPVTVYSTLRLLCDAGLARCHRFAGVGNNGAVYERATANVSHIHLVCRRCGRVREVRDAELAAILASRRLGGWPVAYFDLYAYALCPRCRRRGNKI